ncbi:hypothetical protein M2150_000483 [Lachnospiraceae bacterium PM6-15]|uniref:hypothetical protein n=1 Tax=Ohessyouella blattaphilus TaxID=2949333 RepID=UPI003E30529A
MRLTFKREKKVDDIKTITETKMMIEEPELLHIDEEASVSYGAHQEWYSSWLQRMSGCGPTAAANLLWYLAATRLEGQLLFAGDGTKKADMIRLMEALWRYVTPGLRGVDKASTFTKGVTRFGRDQGYRIKTQTLEVPKEAATRPTVQELEGFLKEAFASNRPVAFLNLSNGALHNLDNWHWVTLVGLEAVSKVTMYDQGERTEIDLERWLATTTGGGAFVTIDGSRRRRL